jgi:phosphoribosylaminoimidazolecarboxamide formyltransferase/IMP cyclohydrolase
MTKLALLSVYDKTHLSDFARALRELGWQLIASGGTAQAIAAAGVPVTTVEAFTRSPEILGGRVKTLHPAIHGGILARDTEQDARDLALVNPPPQSTQPELVEGWGLIDMVISNLYPFEQTIAQPNVTEADAIEQIDIGGVALTRAAAKNFERVTIVTDPNDYDAIITELRAHGATTRETRKRLAQKAFAVTAHYDAAIQAYLLDSVIASGAKQSPRLTQEIASHTTLAMTLSVSLSAFSHVQSLRYGENPHQSAELYADGGPLGGTLVQGKELSYNNLLDLDAAWRAVVMFDDPSIVIVKHLSPCGIASADTLTAAFSAALASDPISAFGGVIAANRVLDGETVKAFGELFIECIAALGYTDEARTLLAKRKHCRLLTMPDLKIEPIYELRSINRGLLKQTIDLGDPADAEWKVMSERQPTADEMRALRFAWIACQHVKSNAIVFARSDAHGVATVGIGGGQPNRVDCVRIAAQRAGDKARGAVMASDAFFPFPDSIEVAAAAGIAAVAQPGGSVRDAETLAAANKAGMALVTTGVRHFRH